MKIPSKIKIGPHVYVVKFQKGILQHHRNYGQSRHSSNEILIDPDISQSQKEDTFMHEVLHCIDQQIIFTEKDKEEDSIGRLSPSILGFLKDNNLLK